MGKVAEPDARAMYLTMGVDRSLAKVAARFPEGHRVSLKTLKQWSSRFGWPALAKAHDAKVSAAVVEKVEKQQIRDGSNRLLRMHAVVDAGMAKLEELVGKVTKPEQIPMLTEALLDIEKQAQVMTGGVSDRTERVGPGLQRSIEEQFGLPVEPDRPEAPAKPH